MKVLVTGGTGFVGNHTLTALSRCGHEVLALHRSGNPPSLPNVHWLPSTLDQPDWQRIDKFVGKNQFALIHLAAYGVDPRIADWDACFLWNVIHSLRLWRDATSRGVCRIVTCGSCFEYGAAGDRYEFIPTTAAPEPLSPYAASKAAATMALHALSAKENLQSLSIRPCVVFGEGEPPHRLWPSLRRAALAGKDFPMTLGSQIRDFVCVEHLARALVNGVSRDDIPSGRLIIENFGSGKAQSVLEFAMEWWSRWSATGKLLIGSIPERTSEAKRFVPEVSMRSLL